VPSLLLLAAPLWHADIFQSLNLQFLPLLERPLLEMEELWDAGRVRLATALLTAAAQQG
jgi:hypothetical protein